QAGVGGNPVQPGTGGRSALEAFAGTPGSCEHLLDMVFGLVERSKHPVAVQVQLAPVPANDVVEVQVMAAHGVPSGQRQIALILPPSAGVASSDPRSGSARDR